MHAFRARECGEGATGARGAETLNCPDSLVNSRELAVALAACGRRHKPLTRACAKGDGLISPKQCYNSSSYYCCCCCYYYYYQREID